MCFGLSRSSWERVFAETDEKLQQKVIAEEARKRIAPGEYIHSAEAYRYSFQERRYVPTARFRERFPAATEPTPEPAPEPEPEPVPVIVAQRELVAV